MFCFNFNYLICPRLLECLINISHQGHHILYKALQVLIQTRELLKYCGYNIVVIILILFSNDLLVCFTFLLSLTSPMKSPQYVVHNQYH